MKKSFKVTYFQNVRLEVDESDYIKIEYPTNSQTDRFLNNIEAKEIRVANYPKKGYKRLRQDGTRSCSKYTDYNDENGRRPCLCNTGLREVFGDIPEEMYYKKIS